MIVGITGHRKLDDPAWVKAELAKLLATLPRPLVGVSSLAVGADQLFAQAVLECDADLWVILPFARYSATLDTDQRDTYLRLLVSAVSSEVLADRESKDDAYLAAGKRIVDSSELMIAVWDGLPARGKGGTADIVAYATMNRRRLIHANPISRSVS